jgi:Protein of unknown function with PCYCGC motif
MRDALPFSLVGEVHQMTGKYAAAAIALSLTLVSAGLAQLRPALFPVAEAAGAQMPMDMSGAQDQGVPSYHAYSLKPPYPATLDPKQFPDALNRNVYAMAAKIKPVLYQQPCYCYCDRHEGHKSLLDCFAGMHGSECDICQKEAVLSYQLTRKGKTPAQIRAAIIRGDWRSVNLNPYIAETRAR